jgi:hypothetical protein
MPLFLADPLQQFDLLVRDVPILGDPVADILDLRLVPLLPSREVCQDVGRERDASLPVTVRTNGATRLST